MLFNPKQAQFGHLDTRSREIMQKTIDFFETKGNQRLKADDHERVWYDDFIQFVKKEGIFSTLLTPIPYGGEGCRWDTFRNMDFNEILGFYSLAYWYTWQVTILGLGPIWMGKRRPGCWKTAGSSPLACRKKSTVRTCMPATWP
jgi:acyl-CoA dehydrogenase